MLFIYLISPDILNVVKLPEIYLEIFNKDSRTDWGCLKCFHEESCCWEIILSIRLTQQKTGKCFCLMNAVKNCVLCYLSFVFKNQNSQFAYNGHWPLANLAISLSWNRFIHLKITSFFYTFPARLVREHVKKLIFSGNWKQKKTLLWK